ncbi:hypothetical protein HQ544_04900 [Candidatus Falkowbacteria bacterium]|nr:hypothetical protein [Candidatus Falkowbacteria bacterium]
MSLSLYPETKTKTSQNSLTIWLFLVILALLLGLAIFLYKILKTPKITQNLPINYYIEFDLPKYNQVSGLWLENNPNRQKILGYWQDYLKKIVPKPQKNVFTGKISLIGISPPPIEDETPASRLHDESETPLQAPEGEDIYPRQEQENHLVFLATVSSSQKLQEYFQELGQVSKTTNPEISVLTPKNSILNQNKFYYTINKNQLITASSPDVLNLILESKTNLKFPQRNILETLSFSTKILKIYTKPQGLSPLSQFFMPEAQPIWLQLNLSPSKAIIDFENSLSKNQIIQKDWLKFLIPSQNLAIFNANIINIFDNQYFTSTRSTWQELYDFDFEKNIYPILKDTQSLLILKSKDTKISQEPALSRVEGWQNYNYCLIISNINNLVPESAQIQKIEQIAKNVFAKRFPNEEKTTLPDNSTITQLVARPEKFSFETKKLASFSLKYLKKPNFEFAYAFLPDKIIFSDSISFLEQVISQKNIQNQEKVENSLVNCLNDENIPSDFIFFTPDSGFYEKYGLEKLILTNKKACVY